jgi:hypothetical protein
MSSLTDRRRLPWILALLLMLVGSFTAHVVGALTFARHAASGESDGGVEASARVGHGAVTAFPLIAGVALALALVGLAARARRARSPRVRGVAPLWFVLLPPLAFALQELAERLLRAESIPFNPIHEPALLVGLALQLPFGVLAYLIGRALLGLGARLARILRAPAPAIPSVRHVPDLRVTAATRPRISVLGLGHSVRGPPAIAS